jgi:hypothetical protein
LETFLPLFQLPFKARIPVMKETSAKAILSKKGEETYVSDLFQICGFSSL